MLKSALRDAGVTIYLRDYLLIRGVPYESIDAASDGSGGTGVFELRTYQLELGYNPIPKLIGHMAEGLPSKLASDPGAASGDPKGRLVFMGYSAGIFPPTLSRRFYFIKLQLIF